LVMKAGAYALAGVAAVALAGTALAASKNSHVMNVPLPDGSVAHVEYVGDVPPKVTVAPAPLPGGDLWMSGLPSMANFDRMFEQMDRQMRQIEQMARQPAGIPGMNVAAYGNMPAGANSVTVISTSNGGVTCTRTTEVVSQGAGKPPKVTSNVSGNCGASGQPTPQAAPGKPLDRT
jgi:hypothetical protein